jgi:hypothetical protein
MSRFLRLVAAFGAGLATHLAAEQVVISEIMYNPAGTGTPEFVEVQNLTSNRIDMARWSLSGGVSLTLPDFDPGAPTKHFLNEYERIVLSSADPATTRLAYPSLSSSIRVFGPWTGSLSNAGDTIVLQDASGALQARVTYNDDDEWPVSADGAGHSLVLINEHRDIDDWRNWKASPRPLGSPGQSDPRQPEEPLAVTEPSLASAYVVTDYNSTPATNGVPAPARATDTKWKFYAETAAPPTEWRTAAFNDSSWGPSDPALGYAPLGFEPAPASAAFPGLRTPVPANQPLATYYFRTTFQWNGPLSGTTAIFDQFLDDGALVWLNGQSLVRERLATGTISHASLANAESPDATEEFDRMAVTATVLNNKLVNGTNTLAVEVHNRTTSNDDMVMALRMKLLTTNPGVVINEVRPSAVAGQGFVEFHNPLSSAVDLQGHYLSSDPAELTRFQIPGSLVVPAGGLATIDFASSGLRLDSPVQVYLTRPDGISKMAAASLRVPLDGRSAGRKPAGGATWYVFANPTPGAANQSSTMPAVNPLRLSEVHHNGAGRLTWIEVANPATSSASAAGLFLSNSRDLTSRVPLTGTVAAGGHVSVAVDYMVPSDGDLFLYLVDAELTVLDAVKLEPRGPGLPSIQRYPVTSNEWYNATTDTRDAPNAPEVRTAVVINEIMFRPPSSHSSGEFIELHNRSAESVSLAGWQFDEGINYTFPAGATLAPGGHVVVAQNPGYMTTHYPGLSQVFGPFAGTLRNRGERLRLLDERGNPADIVHYETGGQWPQATGGEGSSLELIHPDMDNSQPSAWRASDESQKSVLETYTHTGIYRELRGTAGGTTSARELHLHGVSDAHLLLRNITLTRPGSGNLITTGDATSHNGTSAAGFLCTGTHSQSDTLPRAGATITGDPGFHLISTGTGDSKNNKTEVDCTAIARNDILTLTFQARWISGMPLLVAQTWDRSFGTVFRLPIPNNLGTPGAANSARRPATAPTVDQITHSPVVPSSSQPVVVTAKIASAGGAPTVELVRRLDNINANAAWTTLPMNDTGSGGDATAGDGVFSATVPAQADGAIIQFYVRATAPGGEINEAPRNGATRPAMWIVDNSPPTSRPGTVVHRFIISKYHRDALGSAGWSSKFDWDFPRMSNFEFNATAILGESTFAGGPEVLYNCGMRKGGSPWTRSLDNTLDRMRWKSPGDVRYRNRVKSGIDNDAAGASRFHNRITRYLLHLLGYPVPDHEFIQQIVNESATRIGDDMEPTDSDFFDRAYADDAEGELFEIDDAWFMFDQAPGSPGNEDRIDAGSVTGRWALTDWTAPTVPTSPSADSPIFFHGNWPLRFPEDRYDYASLAAFIKTTVTGTPASDSWRDQMSRQLDIERAAMYAAVRGYIGEWDNFTLNRGKNGYFYRRSADGKFEFHHWDSDLAFQNTGEAFIGSAGGQGWTNLTARPWFRQRIHFYLTELLNKYTRDSVRMNAWLGAMNYQAALSDTLAPFKTSGFSYPGWFSGRQTPAITFINGAGSNAGSPNFTRPFSVTTASGQTVGEPLFTLDGLAPSRVFTVDVEGHPEARFDWLPDTTSYGKWRLSGIALASGLNSLNVRALDLSGAVITSIPFTVTLTPNAPPLAALAADPPSFNLAVNELIAFDATASRDPEGGALTYAWTVSPTLGAVLTPTTPGRATLRCTRPGVYALDLAVTDPAGNSVTLEREVTVYAAGGFQSFGTGTVLDPGLTATNVAMRDNTPANTWYSLEDEPGMLLIQVLDGTSVPLNAGAFPTVTQDLPDTANWTLQTRTSFETRAFGHFQTGLIVDLTENGQPVRYVFGPEGRNSFTIRRSVNGGPFTSLIGAVRLNAGGPLLSEIDGTLWAEDAHFVGGAPFTQNYTYGFSNTTLNDTGRGDPAGFTYAVPLANGVYDVTLRAATATAVTQSVAVNGGPAQSWSVAAGLNAAEKQLALPRVSVDTGLLSTAITKTSSTGSAVLTAFEAVPVETTFTALRVQRTPTQLLFAHQQAAGVWVTVAVVPLAPAATAGRGGVFVATDAAQSTRIGFDYLLLVDPGQASPQTAALRLTEIMYEPSAGGVEYLELANISSQPLDLTGANFVDGQPFAAFTFGGDILQAGEHAVLVADLAGFRARYGPTPRVLGVWASGALNNAGETVVLRDASGNTIHDFTYGTSAPWPTSPRGQGPSLEVINAQGDYNDPFNWRASFEPLGSPGASGLARDTDGDGQSDGKEGLFGTNPADATSFVKVTASLAGNGSVTLGWPSVAGRAYRVERTADLRAWSALQTVTATSASSSFTDTTASGQPGLYYRVVALP